MTCKGQIMSFDVWHEAYTDFHVGAWFASRGRSELNRQHCSVAQSNLQLRKARAEGKQLANSFEVILGERDKRIFYFRLESRQGLKKKSNFSWNLENPTGHLESV